MSEPSAPDAGVPVGAEPHALLLALVALLVVGAVVVDPAPNLDALHEGVALQAGPARALGHVVVHLAVGPQAALLLRARVPALLGDAGLVQGALRVGQALVGVALGVGVARPSLGAAAHPDVVVRPADGAAAARVVGEGAGVLAVPVHAGLVVPALGVGAAAHLDGGAEGVGVARRAGRARARGPVPLDGAEGGGGARVSRAGVDAAAVAAGQLRGAVAVAPAADLHRLGDELAGAVAPLDVARLALADHDPLGQLVLDGALGVLLAGPDAEAGVGAAAVVEEAGLLAGAVPVGLALELLDDGLDGRPAALDVGVAEVVRDAVADAAVVPGLALGVGRAGAGVDALLAVALEVVGAVLVHEALVAPALVVGVAPVAVEARADGVVGVDAALGVGAAVEVAARVLALAVVARLRQGALVVALAAGWKGRGGRVRLAGMRGTVQQKDNFGHAQAVEGGWEENLQYVIQSKSVTVTPLGHQISVTLTDCHCKQKYLIYTPIMWDMP